MEKYGKIEEAVKGGTIDLFSIFLIIFIFVAGIVGYYFYLKEKNIELSKANEGICPKCNQQTIDLVDVRGSGCSPKIITYRCYNCGYENSFTEQSGCSI